MFDIDEDTAELERRADALVQNHRRMLEKLIKMRSDHNMTQADVAFAMGVSQPTVAAFERYDSNPTLATIRRYALAVHARLDDEVIDDCDHTVPASWMVAERRADRTFWPQMSSPCESFPQWAVVGPGRRFVVQDA